MGNLLTLVNVGWLFTVVVAFMLGKSAVGKLMGSAEAVGNFNYMKLAKYRMAVGAAEAIGVVMLIIPGLTLLGAVTIACLMTAAVALHLSLMGGAKVTAPIVVGVLAILAHLLRSL